MNDESTFLWLRQIGRYWILPLEMIGRLLLLCAVLVPLVLRLAGIRGWGFAVGMTLGALAIALEMGHYSAFYSLIRCPKCGYNPTLYKNGKNMPTKTAWKRLQSMASCPVCKGNHNEPDVA